LVHFFFSSSIMIARDILFNGTAFQIAVEMRRAEKQINGECTTLRKNWFSSLRDWSLFPNQYQTTRTLPFMPTCRDTVNLSNPLFSQETEETNELFNITTFGLFFPSFSSHSTPLTFPIRNQENYK